MNSVSEIIDVSSVDESVDAKKSISKLLLEIKRYQEQTKSYIDANYSDFLLNLGNNEIYLEEGQKLIKEVENILQTVENDTKTDLYTATDEVKFYIEELQEISLGLKISYKILKIDKLFELLEESRNNNEYLEVMDLIGKIKALIEDPTDKILNRLDCYQNIKIKYHIEAEMLLHNLKQRFEQLVQFSEKLFQNTKSISLKITKDRNQLEKTVVALFNAKYNPKKLCDFLVENVFQPIVKKPVSIEFVDDNDSEFVQLFLSYSLKDLGEDLRPNYNTVFNSVETVIKCLEHMNIKIRDGVHVFNVFSDIMKKELLKLLVNECIMYSIPDTMDEMNKSTLVDDILNFDNFLKNCSILNEEKDEDLQECAKKMGILFRNRFCSNILDNAIEIMKKDLHDMTLFTDNNSTSSASLDNPLIFPRCMVSKSTNDLIALMENVLRQASTVDTEISERLLSTIPTILTHYMNEVPTYHEKFLMNIPQQTALFHNNCMYLAHWLESKCSENLDSIANLIKLLQKVGSEYLASQIKNQHNQLMEILQGFDLSDVVSELSTGPQKVVRQCLRQLDLLKNVWQTILPESVYNKTMSNLLNDFCSEVLKRILTVEDLPATVANELVDICAIILDRAPTIFQDKHEVYEVKTWMKLIQLKMILGASLVEITEQWSEGKGPLTMNYKAEEIKHLIRALFQNTDRRANALASIV